jgi:antitoxin component YwqK of YwqJK toxin-antitoxin module
MSAVRRVSGDDIDYTEDLIVVYEGEPFTGEVIDYYPDGQPETVTTYDGGIKEGPERVYFSNGSIKSEHWRKTGIWHGMGRTWHRNGQQESETRYEHGDAVAVKRWSEDGELLD